MYELKITNHFAAAHNLREFYGKCENLHGHNWFVEVKVRAKDLDKIGLVMDFGVIKKLLNEVLDLLDHKYLNELEYFQTRNPSSENIAYFIFQNLNPGIQKSSEGRVQLYSVSAWESDNAAATYIHSPDN
ncbi:MAG: 6-carboxytetrahydropterin synthase QueD [Deltaproteobacteria bacterium]|jgi:6-pyruvoyltetrahydropterin/6-carboxytetrahydropterin synthase|nr:6-carboxytetrahydropterin synthase QueD [Deltaproteobacteria bacterium]